MKHIYQIFLFRSFRFKFLLTWHLLSSSWICCNCFVFAHRKELMEILFKGPPLDEAGTWLHRESVFHVQCRPIRTEAGYKQQMFGWWEGRLLAAILAKPMGKKRKQKQLFFHREKLSFLNLIKSIWKPQSCLGPGRVFMFPTWWHWLKKGSHWSFSRWLSTILTYLRSFFVNLHEV